MPVRAILDTNVLISALISPTGTPARLLVAAEQGSYELIVSDRLLGEMEDVLRREKFSRYVTSRDVADYLLRLRLASTRAKEGEVFPVSPDAKDDYLFALALASGADFLVSGDGHLLDMPPALTHRRLAQGLDSSLLPVVTVLTTVPSGPRRVQRGLKNKRTIKKSC